MWSEILYGVLFEPRATLRRLAEERPLAHALFTFLIITIFNLVIYRGVIFQQQFALDDIRTFLWLYQILGALFSICMLFVMAGLFSLLSELLFNKINAAGLLVCLSFASLPGVLGPALYYSSSIVGLPWLGIACSIVVGVWILVLQILSLAESLDISIGQAIALFILPGLLILVGLVVIVLIFSLSGLGIK